MTSIWPRVFFHVPRSEASDILHAQRVLGVPVQQGKGHNSQVLRATYPRENRIKVMITEPQTGNYREEKPRVKRHAHEHQ